MQRSAPFPSASDISTATQMSIGTSTPGAIRDALGYLCVEPFIRTLIDARALKSAFELGLVDYLSAAGRCAVESVEKAIALDPPGAQLLFQLLAANHVVELAN